MPACVEFGGHHSGRKRKAVSWGCNNDKSACERERVKQTKKRQRVQLIQERAAHKQQQRQFFAEANAQDPLECPICIDAPMTHLLIGCGQTADPGHRNHGVCSDCVRIVMSTGQCMICRGPVTACWDMGGADFFVVAE